jgi:hypothetical protein
MEFNCYWLGPVLEEHDTGRTSVLKVRQPQNSFRPPLLIF